MRTKIMEATNGPNNWGKFLIGVFDAEDWTRHPKADGCDSGFPLLRAIGKHPHTFHVLDLQTGEGALFVHAGAPPEHAGISAHFVLERTRVWVCPLFEPFLTWLYAQPFERIRMLDLPDAIDLPDAPFALHGYRRKGKP